ncbi:carbohydrate-binding protein [Clostridium taeniosporum]|uniref:CBM21 domain-containing protein n=1 Tax=Clostridium taeniosporum TaxID=394958 RepID=A0A1D7XPR4_9CLOT|nr:carbohydrate-binding protein [Clostridium taeniosporum]AOR25159.1 hypothetical protein BGI42_15585 [Clostridium taeniosporum]
MKKFKKALSMLVSVFIFTGMLMINGVLNQGVQAAETNKVSSNLNVEGNSSNLPVQLYYAKYINCGYYGGAVEGAICIKNLAYDKKVIVHYASGEGNSWKDKEAHYVKTNPDGSEVWSFRIAFKGLFTAFAIKYEVNGKTYWDNNNSKNYSVNYEYDEVALGKSNSCVIYSGLNPLSGKFCVKNTGKKPTNIKVRYTEDNWKTYKEATIKPATNYVDSVSNYYFNADDCKELTKEIKFALYYEIDGIEYCDDNFGSYYRG